LIEYQKEAYNMFVEMMERIQDEVVELVFRMQIVEKKEMKGVFTSLPQKMEHREFSGMSLEAQKARQAELAAEREEPGEAPKETPVRHEGPRVGRNDPCPCGSGKKYKKCCGING
jgi:preprotein translocase subunit SecA